MADSYTKLFSDIVDSSIWSEDSETRVVWITLLALCNNSDGYVRGSIGWLAGKAHISAEACAAALKKFSEPDPHSRTPDNEGRRIEFLEDGWLILNYMAFRERLSSNPKTVKTRERVRKHRERYTALRNAESVTQRYTDSVSVPVSDSTPVYSPESRVALHYLNEKSGRHFRESSHSLQTIQARLSENGVDILGVRQMINRQCLLWKGTRFEEFLRPSTLFGKEKFNEYYAAKDSPINNHDPNKPYKPQNPIERDVDRMLKTL